MKIISFIEDENVIKKILSHLNLWLPQYHDPPDYPASNYTPAVLIADTSSKLEVEKFEELQLNMFSSRSYEWWEAGNRKNTIMNAYHESKNLRSNILHKDYENKLSHEDYYKTYEEEYSQEVFYEDKYED
jgi:hypothetical protein